MRDPNRIDYYCDELAELWHKVPDWRLSQFITNAIIVYMNKYGSDTFYVEDADFMKFLREFIEEIINENQSRR